MRGWREGAILELLVDVELGGNLRMDFVRTRAGNREDSSDSC